MTSRAERITASNLGDRLDIANERDELGNMARVFNHIVGTIGAGISTTSTLHRRCFPRIADAFGRDSHDQRSSPRKSTMPEAYREALGNVLEESSRLNQTVDSLLLLARAESTPPGESQPVFVFGDLLQKSSLFSKSWVRSVA